MKTTSILRHVRRRQASAAFRRRASRLAASCRSRSKDPIRLHGGMNLYAFCGCDPVNRLDAYGEIAIFVPFFVPILYQVGVAAVQTLATVVVVVAADRIVSFLGRGGRIKGERNWASSRYK